MPAFKIISIKIKKLQGSPRLEFCTGVQNYQGEILFGDEEIIGLEFPVRIGFYGPKRVQIKITDGSVMLMDSHQYVIDDHGKIIQERFPVQDPKINVKINEQNQTIERDNICMGEWHYVIDNSDTLEFDYIVE